MKNIFICLSILCVTQYGFSQAEHVEDEPYATYMQSKRNGMMGLEYTDPFLNYEGSHYFNDWTYGEIFLKNGEKITGLLLRYEGYTDQLLWLREDYIPCILCKACINGFKLYDDSDNIKASFVVRKGIRLPFENDSADCFLQILAEGQYSFFAFRRVGRLPDVFKLVDNTRYYIFDNDKYEKISLRIRDLLNVSFIDKSKMKSIIKTNKIRLRNNEQEFIRAISIYNMSS
ncbi:MAG: hypothetical protein JW894_12100 [Bacteroidales bacterium]|nr:hypothetical protein [Bacteroidales bacterium]